MKPDREITYKASIRAAHVGMSPSGIGLAFGFTWDRQGLRFSRVLVAMALVVLMATAALSVAATSGSSRGQLLSVIVREAAGAGSGPEHLVRSLGGTVERRLSIIGGFVASIPSGSLARLAGSEGVLSVTRNARVELMDDDDDSVDGYDPDSGAGSWKRTVEAVKAKDMWKSGYRGQGIDVALIDSGVAPVEGIANHLVHGPDLSFESQADNLRYLDTYGHGTHMAGIIAGRDSNVGWGHEDEDLDEAFLGIAPRSRIVSVKVATSNGATDVSQVIAAIDWVVQNRNIGGLNIRVLNLSFGTDGTQAYVLDPLAYAAEVAWRKGIVVVVAAGNSNFGSNRLNNPAFDPFVITVGATDTKGTSSTSDDVIPAWSARGDATRRPDLVAPGKSLVSLRSGGANLDRNNPLGRVGTSRFFKGSGTSQSAAVVSGAAALLLSQRPSLTPNQVKHLLKSTATRLSNADSQGQGSGIVNLKAARDASTPSALASFQAFVPATGLGTLEGARGTVHLSDGGADLTGEMDIFGASFDTSVWAAASLTGNTWSAGAWNGNTWAGNTWSGNTWAGNTWAGNTWAGNTWSGNTWAGNTWSGNTWSGNTWSGNTWAGNTWSGNTWAGGGWSSASWGTD